ncbi:ATP-binding response regulator [Paracidovorax cattleyae]|uniref:ATP-binding response regulator n=1 Tax=Paracidovorax cattleyae TaxID=80868 RepID=UPI0018AF55B0|nr:hybrid sensor histidine kinase/response regulator [Paracidovorax cattleyae]
MKDSAPVYAERLKLVLGGIAQSLPIGFLLATLLVVVFEFTSGQLVTAVSASTGEAIRVMTARIDDVWLGAWYLAVLVGRLLLVLYCRHTLRHGFDFSEMRGITRRLAAGKGYEGVIWGCLGWIVVDEASSPASTAMLLGVMAAISSNAVSLLSPIRLLFAALIVPMLLVAGGRFLVMDGLMYQAMGACCLLYVVGQYGQAGLIGRGLSESIRLRFENLDLIQRLEVEKLAAHEAKEHAEQANQAKSRFLAAASHDLRQPVHALGFFLEALSSGPAGTSQRLVVDHAKAASAASREMLDTLLDFSLIEAGVIQPQFSACLIQTTLHKLEQELAPLADAKGLIYRSRDSQAVVRTDMRLLEMILRNLISNAIRYTGRGGVLIGCRRRGQRLSIEVFDTGIGIASEQHREIFREFHQLGNPERDRRKGLGLGLAIAEGLSHSLDQPLTLSSRIGRGSVFRISVPLAPSDARISTMEWIQPSRFQGLTGRRILVIDDDETVRAAMHTLLESYGCIDRTVENLEQALAVNDWLPDAIICDYRLRDRQTGADVILALRDHYAYPVPALLMTGDTAPERLREAMSGDIALLHKPVAPDKFWRTLSKILTDG